MQQEFGKVNHHANKSTGESSERDLTKDATNTNCYICLTKQQKSFTFIFDVDQDLKFSENFMTKLTAIEKQNG